jgi:hypothetical protein
MNFALRHRKTAVAMAVFIQVTSCADEECPDEFEVSAWCVDTQACTLDGASADCSRGCEVAKGAMLEIPIERILDRLDALQAVELQAFGSPALNPAVVEVRLDDAVGIHRPPIGPVAFDTQAIIEWDPLPDSPRSLTLQYTTGEQDTALIQIDLIDYACERENRGVE